MGAVYISANTGGYTGQIIDGNGNERQRTHLVTVPPRVRAVRITAAGGGGGGGCGHTANNGGGGGGSGETIAGLVWPVKPNEWLRVYIGLGGRGGSGPGGPDADGKVGSPTFVVSQGRRDFGAETPDGLTASNATNFLTVGGGGFGRAGTAGGPGRGGEAALRAGSTAIITTANVANFIMADGGGLAVADNVPAFVRETGGVIRYACGGAAGYDNLAGTTPGIMAAVPIVTGIAGGGTLSYTLVPWGNLNGFGVEGSSLVASARGGRGGPGLFSQIAQGHASSGALNANSYPRGLGGGGGSGGYFTGGDGFPGASGFVLLEWLAE